MENLQFIVKTNGDIPVDLFNWNIRVFFLQIFGFA